MAERREETRTGYGRPGALGERGGGVVGSVGPRLRERRTSRGLSLTALSERTGISVSTLSRLETGARIPGLEHLVALARAHHVSLDELVGTRFSCDPRLRYEHVRGVRGGPSCPSPRQQEGCGSSTRSSGLRGRVSQSLQSTCTVPRRCEARPRRGQGMATAMMGTATARPERFRVSPAGVPRPVLARPVLAGPVLAGGERVGTGSAGPATASAGAAVRTEARVHSSPRRYEPTADTCGCSCWRGRCGWSSVPTISSCDPARPGSSTTPRAHWLGPAEDRPVEVLNVHGREGQRIRVRARPKQ